MARAISASVGAGGANRKQDAMTVQELLNGVPSADGGPVNPLVVDGLPWEKTIAAIKRFQQVQLGHKWPDGRVDPDGPTLERLNDFDSVPEISIDYTVSGYKPIIGQPTNMTCWATVYTMIRSWKDGKKYTISQAMALCGQKYLDMFNKNLALQPSETGAFYRAAKLTARGMQCYPIETWHKMLRSHGLLMIGTMANLPPVLGLHMRIVQGIYGEGSPQATVMRMLDPAPIKMGSGYAEPFMVFNTKYEQVINHYPVNHFQIAHF
jgi:hypothetical protein